MSFDPLKEEDSTKVELPKEEALKDPATEERQRILQMLFRDKERMTVEFSKVVHYTGSLVTGSMKVAYSRAINDVIKLILKESTNEKSV